MALVFERYKELKNRPGLHVLLVGASHYPHLSGGRAKRAKKGFGMVQLKSSMLSVVGLYEWLLKRKDRLKVPLKSCRIIGSPSEKEEYQIPGVQKSKIELATYRDFVREANAWRDDAKDSPDSQTLFYFAGHGLNRTRSDSLMLCSDFGNPDEATFTNVVPTCTLIDGMAPSRESKDMARNQFYFFDCCRTVPLEMNELDKTVPGPFWDVPALREGYEDDRNECTFYSTTAGKAAFSLVGSPTLFCQALLNAVNGGALEILTEPHSEKFHITSFAIMEAVNIFLEDLNAKHRTDQHCRSGKLSLATLGYLDEPPLVKIMLDIQPPDAAAVARISMHCCRTQTAHIFNELLKSNPFAISLPFSVYKLTAKIDPPTAPYKDTHPEYLWARPPKRKWTINVYE